MAAFGASGPLESTAGAATSTEKECAAASKASEQLRSAGDLVGARARLAACSFAGCSRQMRDECARQAAVIEAAVPAVILEAKDETSNNLTAVRVTLDGSAVLDHLDGSALPVNPGEHRVAVEADGFRRAETTFVAREGQKKLRVVVYLDTTAGPPPVDPSIAAAVPGAPVGREAPPLFGTRRKKVALALGGAGLAGVAVGTIWALMAKSTYDHALSSECAGDVTRCSSQGIADGKTAHRQATVATVGFVAAGALLAAGATLFFTSPKETGVAVVPTLDGQGGVTVVAKW